MSAQHKKLFELKQKQGVVSFNRSSHILLPLSSLKSQQTISDVQVQLGSLEPSPILTQVLRLKPNRNGQNYKNFLNFQIPKQEPRNACQKEFHIENVNFIVVQKCGQIYKQFDGLDAAKNIVKNSDAVVVKMQKTQNIDYLAVGLGNSHGNQGLNFRKQSLIVHQTKQCMPSTSYPQLDWGCKYNKVSKISTRKWNKIWQISIFNFQIEQTDFDVKNNGCSLLSLIVVNNTIYCANLGDSKAAFFYRKDFDPSGPKEIRKFVQKNLNFVHDTNNSKEVQRILNKGGKIDQAVYKGRKCGNLKVWVPKQNQPGVKLTRCFGNLIGKTVGISAEPEFSEFKVPKSGYLLIGSTGLWEILDVLVIDQILDAHFPPTCQEDIDLAIKQIGDQTKILGLRWRRLN